MKQVSWFPASLAVYGSGIAVGLRAAGGAGFGRLHGVSERRLGGNRQACVGVTNQF
jgi:hypothetical protein